MAAASPLQVLVADDERFLRELIAEALEDEGYDVATAADGAEASQLLDQRGFDVVITDISMPELDGLTLFRRLRRDRPQTAVILMSAFGTIPEAVTAMQEKAVSYLHKPFDLQSLSTALDQIAQRRARKADLAALRAKESNGLNGLNGLGELLGISPEMVELRRLIEIVAATDSPVLVTGESGTGKELVAQRVHALSNRRAKPLVAINCAAFPEPLLEAELFGHERGAFTGAVRRREGRFVAAHGGSLFLDEIAEMPLASQAKLLRVLQQGTFEPLGTNVTQHADVRLIAATNKDLRRCVAEGRFREDLYYRAKVFELAVPPLRARRVDLPMLADAFCRRFLARSARTGVDTPEILPRVWKALAEYPFPGNVRELEHAMQHAMVLAGGGEIDLEHLPSELRQPPASELGQGPPPDLRPLAVAMKDYEREYLCRALSLTGGNRTRAAEMLGISRKNLWEKLRERNLRAELAVDGGEGARGAASDAGADASAGPAGERERK
jgi:DNA-binding NtrC family response regulator